MGDILLLGASGLSREVLSARMPGHRVVGILDDDPDLKGRFIGGVEVLGGIELAGGLEYSLTVCVGSGAARRAIVERLEMAGIDEDRFATLIDEDARVPASCTVGAGSILLAGVVLTADVHAGKHVVVMPRVTLTHDDIVGDYATFAAGASIGGTVRVGEGAYIGMNATVRQGLSIGKDAVIGMGAAVVRNVPDAQTWVGVPAREVRT